MSYKQLLRFWLLFAFLFIVMILPVHAERSMRGIQKTFSVEMNAPLGHIQNLADSPKPMWRYDRQHTGRSLYAAPLSEPPLVWEYDTIEGPPFHGAPSLGSDGTIYVGDRHGNVHAVYPDGTQKWVCTLNDDAINQIRTAPAIAQDGTIYVVAEDGIYALRDNGDSCVIKWARRDVGASLRSSPLIGPDGTIYFGSDDHNLYALNPADGTTKWAYSTNGAIRSSPAMSADGSRIYIATKPGRLYALDASAGTEYWHLDFASDEVWSSPALAEVDGKPRIYIGSRDHKLYAIEDDGSSGTIVWQYDTGARVDGTPAIAVDNTIYVASRDNKTLHALHDEGNTYTLKWTRILDAILRVSPVIDRENHVIVPTHGGSIYLFDADGNQIWYVSHTPAKDIEGEVAVDACGNIYAIGCMRGHLVKLAGPGCAPAPSVAVQKFVPEQEGVQGNVVLVGSTVEFQVVITNTGETTLAYVPLHDEFDNTCLQYTAKSASPPENQRDASTLDWLDLTISFGRDLAPGESFTVTIPFQAVAPDDDAWNRATVEGAEDLNENVAPAVQSTASVICREPASIGDRVWNDANNNGVQDPGEGGINGVTVRLYQDDGDHVFEPGTDDVLVATQTTSGDGGYDFTMLYAGSYWVDVDESTVPTGYELSTGNDPMEVTVGYGDDYNDADFGYVGRGDISGTVFYDWDEDGEQDAGEEGIGNVQVCLYRDDGDDTYDSGDTQEECKDTNGDGTYVFNDYLPGTYFVVEEQPAGLESTTPDVREVELVVVGPSGSATGNNFGEIVRGRIGDFVWVDSDGDGEQDSSETAGVANVPLHVTGVNIINETIDITVTTSVTGYYTVEDLLPGTYTVTAPSNYNGYVLTTSNIQTTTLSLGDMDDLTLDFGYIAPTGLQLQYVQIEPSVREVTLQWEVRVSGESAPIFRVWRSELGHTWELLTPEGVSWATRRGNTASYLYHDREVQPGTTYLYRLEDEQGTLYGPWQVAVPEVDDGGDTLLSTRVFLPFISR